MKKISVYFAAAFVLIAIGCSKTTNQDLAKLRGQMAVTPDFNTLFPILKENCKSCHRAGGSAGVNLELNSTIDVAYNDLLSRSLENRSSPSTCQTVRRVQPGDPKKSYLMGTLFRDYNTTNFAGVAGCQPSFTPDHQDKLNDEEKRALATWIQNGAKR